MNFNDMKYTTAALCMDALKPTGPQASKWQCNTLLCTQSRSLAPPKRLVISRPINGSGSWFPHSFPQKKKDDFFSHCFLELVHQWLWEKTESLRGGSRKQHSGPGMGCLCCGQNRYMPGIKGAGNHSLTLLKTWDTSEAIQVAKACC